MKKFNKKEYGKKWRKENPKYGNEYLKIHPEFGSEYKKKWLKDLKIEVFTHYSNGELKCRFCNFNDLRALVLDHINDDGANHQRSISKTGKTRVSTSKIYYDLKKKGFPKGYQVLCANCNTIKEHDRRQKKK